MTINAQSGVGRIRLFEDFCANEDPVALTASQANIGAFYVGGSGITGGAQGAAVLDSDGLSGVVQLTVSNTDTYTTALMTGICFDVALMGTLVLEARVRLDALTARAVFIGFSSAASYNTTTTEIADYSAATTITLTASSLAGFFYSSQLTDLTDWHGIYNGGTTTGVTTSGSLDFDEDAVAGDFQVLRVEIDNNGTARWFVDGALKQTVEGALSTTTDIAAYCGVGANANTAAAMDVDYLLVEANRDWNA